jgi:acetyltransferase-like isoleucine patch superfamily enzyme
MSLFLFVDRVKNKIINEYRKIIFQRYIKCPHKDFNLVGKVTLINSNVKLGHHVRIYPDVMLFGDGLIEIGDNVDIGNGTIIYSSKNGGVSIGDNTLIAANCYIIDCDHGIKKYKLIREQGLVSKAISIGNDVWIAENCTILKGSTIRDGAVIGAKCLVNSEIESNAIAVGVPARVIKYRC